MAKLEEAAWKPSNENETEKRIGQRLELGIDPQLPLSGSPAKPDTPEKTQCQADYLPDEN